MSKLVPLNKWNVKDNTSVQALPQLADHLPAVIFVVGRKRADQIVFLSPRWTISTLLFELLNGKFLRRFKRALKVWVTVYNPLVLFVRPLAPGSAFSCFLCLARSLDSSQCGHSPMHQLRLSKQQSLGKFALVQDYVNYHGIITSLKQAEINYLWWNECKMRK